ncbi:hypothetical protein EON63_01635 [archaeon]|nr:MAG: hypothetical protein EON63_01635 [archaeon]
MYAIFKQIFNNVMYVTTIYTQSGNGNEGGCRGYMYIQHLEIQIVRIYTMYVPIVAANKPHLKQQTKLQLTPLIYDFYIHRTSFIHHYRHTHHIQHPATWLA